MFLFYSLRDRAGERGYGIILRLAKTQSRPGRVVAKDAEQCAGVVGPVPGRIKGSML